MISNSGTFGWISIWCVQWFREYPHQLFCRYPRLRLRCTLASSLVYPPTTRLSPESGPKFLLCRLKHSKRAARAQPENWVSENSSHSCSEQEGNFLVSNVVRTLVFPNSSKYSTCTRSFFVEHLLPSRLRLQPCVCSSSPISSLSQDDTFPVMMKTSDASYAFPSLLCCIMTVVFVCPTSSCRHALLYFI